MEMPYLGTTEECPPRDYRIIHLCLCVCYVILSLLCLGHFMYKLYTSHRTTQTNWHNLFHPLLFFGSLVRGLYMFIQFAPHTIPQLNAPNGMLANPANTIISFTPSFIFFSAYLIILFRWAQIYHNSYEMTSLKFNHLKILFFFVNGLMYAVLVTLFTLEYIFYDNTGPPNKHNNTRPNQCTFGGDIIQGITSGFCTALYMFVPLGFAVYTFRITRKFRYLPSRSPAKREVSLKLQRFTILVLAVFCIRAVFTAYSNIFSPNMPIVYWWSDGVYYFLLEIVPLLLMFLILRLHNKGGMDSSGQSSGPSATTPLINHSFAF
eukprot:Phypoly_transcript_13309.p1 GENE.Phypoly_transcript_13309~~Phypoly_transcript_13309.p1  ORF type:complete len:320 (+),score=19.42 Phypoly_transcript_13309:72-1031(+)